MRRLPAWIAIGFVSVLGCVPEAWSAGVERAGVVWTLYGSQPGYHWETRPDSARNLLMDSAAQASPFAAQKVYSVGHQAALGDQEESFVGQLKKALRELKAGGAAEPELTLFFDSHGEPGGLCQQGKDKVEYAKILKGILDAIDADFGFRASDLRIHLMNTACHSGSMREALQAMLPGRSGKYRINLLTAAQSGKKAGHESTFKWFEQDMANMNQLEKRTGFPVCGECKTRAEGFLKYFALLRDGKKPKMELHEDEIGTHEYWSNYLDPAGMTAEDMLHLYSHEVSNPGVVTDLKEFLTGRLLEKKAKAFEAAQKISDSPDPSRRRGALLFLAENGESSDVRARSFDQLLWDMEGDVGTGSTGSYFRKRPYAQMVEGDFLNELLRDRKRFAAGKVAGGMTEAEALAKWDEHFLGAMKQYLHYARPDHGRKPDSAISMKKTVEYFLRALERELEKGKDPHEAAELLSSLDYCQASDFTAESAALAKKLLASLPLDLQQKSSCSKAFSSVAP